MFHKIFLYIFISCSIVLQFIGCVTVQEWKDAKTLERHIKIDFNEKKGIYKITGPVYRSAKNIKHSIHLISQGTKSELKHEIIAIIQHRKESCEITNILDQQKEKFDSFQATYYYIDFPSCLLIHKTGLAKKIKLRFRIIRDHLEEGKQHGMLYNIQGKNCHMNIKLPKSYLKSYLKILDKIE